MVQIKQYASIVKMVGGGVAGLQPSLQNRVYDINGISTAITTAPFFMPNFLITP